MGSRNQRWSPKWSLWCSPILLLISVGCAVAQTHRDAVLPTLEVGRDEVGNLVAGQVVDYSLNVPEGYYLYLGATQLGVDFVLSLLDEDGTPVASADGPAGVRGQEVIALADASGGQWTVRLAVKPDSPSGSFLLWIDDLRPALATDRQRAAAELIFAEATHLDDLETEGERLRSIELYEETIPMWRELGDQSAEATTLSAISSVWRKLGRLDRARDLIARAVALQRETGSCRQLAIALNNQGTVLHRIGAYREALDSYLESLKLRKECGTTGSGQVLSNIAYCLRDMGEYDRAREYFDLASQADTEAGATDPKARATRQAELAWIRVQTGDLEGVWEAFSEAIEVVSHTGDSQALGGLYRRRGVAWLTVGNLQNALSDFRRSLELSQTGGDYSATARALAHLGDTQRALGLHEESLASLREAIATSQRSGDRQRQTLARLLLGRTLLDVGEVEEAIAEQEAALQLANEISGSYYPSLVHQALAEAHLAAGNLSEAKDQIEDGLVLSQQSLVVEGRLLRLRGVAARLEGRADRAREDLRLAAEVAAKTQDRLNEAEVFLELARLDWAAGEFDQARSGIESSLALTERIRSEVLQEEFRSSFLAARSVGYELLVGVLMEQHKAEPEGPHLASALLASELSRSRSLLDLMEEAHGPEVFTEPDLLRRERDLRQRLSDLTATRALGAPGTARDSTPELEAALASYRKVQEEIRAMNPGWSLQVRPSSEDLERLRSRLPADTLLVEYYLGESAGVVWWLDEGGLRGVEVPGRREIATMVGEAHRHLTERNRTVAAEPPPVQVARWRQADADYWSVARQLAAALLPVELLATEAVRWVVVADGPLHHLPLSALPDPRQTGHLRPLVRDREVVYAPSLAVLNRLLDVSRRPEGQQLLVLADPVFGARDPRVQGETTVGEAAPFDRLPFSRSEAEEIASLLPDGEGEVRFGFEADAELLKQQGAGGARWLHLATHAVIDAEHPGLSGLALSLMDPAGNRRNGFLRLYDIYQLDLDAELVVLSGCRTASGRELRGEGVVGLTRGFLYAGAPRVVASLWEVQDKATRELMVRFYRQMIEQKSKPGAALRAAQLELLDSNPWNSPYYWAPFVVQGRWD